MKKILFLIIAIATLSIASACDFQGETTQGKLLNTHSTIAKNCPGKWTKIFQVKGDGTPDQAQILSGSYQNVVNEINQACDFKILYDALDSDLVQSYTCNYMGAESNSTIGSLSFTCGSSLSTGAAQILGYKVFYEELNGNSINFIISESLGLGEATPYFNADKNMGTLMMYYR